jgi:hypothetical protein
MLTEGDIMAKLSKTRKVKKGKRHKRKSAAKKLNKKKSAAYNKILIY